MDIEKLRKQADWSLLEKRPTWSNLTTAELSLVLKESITTLNQWKLRNQIPPPEPRKKGGGYKNRWRINTIRSWLEQRPTDDIDWEFINTHMGEGFESIETAMHYAKKHWNIFELEKPSRY